MAWVELSIEVPGEYAEPVSHLFSRHGEGSAVVETPGGYNLDEGEMPPMNPLVIVKTYLPDDPTKESRRTMIDVGLKLISYLCPLPDLQERTVLDEEWKNQRFEPVRIGRRLVVALPGSEPEPGTQRILVPLEPGLAFGTGHHPTTAMVLAALEDIELHGKTVLDAGCGSGILSIAAIKLGAASVVAFDVEEDAIRSSRRNVERAGISARVEVIHGTLPDERITERHFDVVLANISANVLKLLAPHLLAALKDNGEVIASGVLEPRYEEVNEAFKAVGGELFDRQVTGDWACFKIRHAHLK